MSLCVISSDSSNTEQQVSSDRGAGSGSGSGSAEFQQGCTDDGGEEDVENVLKIFLSIFLYNLIYFSFLFLRYYIYIWLFTATSSGHREASR